MGIEGVPSPANDNAPEFSQSYIDHWLEEFNETIEKDQTHVRAQEELVSLVRKTEVYLRSPEPKEAVVQNLSSAIVAATEQVLDTADSIIPPMDEVERVYALIHDFYEKQKEKGTD